jgi:PAS domain S-box-containing protein
VLVVRAGDGRVVYANEAAEQLLGHGAAELVELHLSSLSVRGERFPEQRAREIAAALEHGGVWSGDIRLHHRDGAELWCAARVTGLEHSDHGAVWIFACSDAAGRRAAEAALADAETRFRTLFEHGPVPVALVGPDLRILDVNDRVCSITGFARTDLLGRSLAQITHPDDVAVDTVLARRLFAGSIPGYRVRKRLVTRGGTPIDVALTTTAVRGPDDRPAYGIATIEPAPAPDPGL